MIILGSTGSIGRNTLEIAERFNLEIETLVAGGNHQLLNQQIKKFQPKIIAVKSSEIAQKVNHNNIFIGENGILEALEKSKSNLVVNSLVGFSGLKPTLKTLELGKKLALANKESLVLAGAFLDIKKIFPIDSEHFGLWYLLRGHNFDEVEDMTLTASGGAFRDWDISKISSAFKHSTR
jgi:1-deoxy-D-xylulose-5-phosphate reductoisomerase